MASKYVARRDTPDKPLTRQTVLAFWTIHISFWRVTILNGSIADLHFEVRGLYVPLLPGTAAVVGAVPYRVK